MRTPRDVPVHYLRPNHTSWTPPVVITFDTETRYTDGADPEVHTLRLWSAELTDRRRPRGKECDHQRARGDSADDLASTIVKWCKGRRTTWCYAHNIGFDLSVTGLIDRFRDRGYEIGTLVIDDAAPWVTLSKGDTTLTLADSWSVLPRSLADIGEAVGIAKPRDPAPDDDHGWQVRCDTDVAILTTALLAAMAWWDERDLGRWTVTGPACGWNAMRHTPNPGKVLIRPDPDECAADRAAIYGGVRYCWRAGKMPLGHYAQWDIERAYLTACRDLPLPVERLASFDALPLDHFSLDCHRHGVVARARVRTNRPRYPVRLDGLVWYPVGEFWTTLAGPDLKDARDRGDLLEVGAGWLHRLGHYLKPWATWLTDILDSADDSTPNVVKIMARGWSRSVVGKWAQRGWVTTELGTSPVAGWSHEEAWHHGTGTRAAILDFGGKRFTSVASAEGENSYPAVLAFVESYVRRALFGVIEAIPPRAVICADTDGVIIDSLSASIWVEPSQLVAPFTIRPKGAWHRIEVLGPQHLTLDDGRRMAGVPAKAEPTGDGRLVGWLWPKLPWQVAHGQPDAYVRPCRTYRLAACYVPGWVLLDGSVRAVEATTGVDGTNHITPWPATAYAWSGAVLRPDQHRLLERYRNAMR